MAEKKEYIRWFEDLRSDDVKTVGGKNASLGEMIHTLKEKGIRVPGGFATTAVAYRKFVAHNDIEEKLHDALDEWKKGKESLEKTGKKIRRLFNKSEFPEDIQQEIKEAYRELCKRNDTDELDVAVRSSATAEDLPEASFAGQQETFLNIQGEDEVLEASQRCFASLFTDRAIVYREEKGFEHLKVAL